MSINPFAWFDGIYVLTTPGYPERKRYMFEQFNAMRAEYGWDFWVDEVAGEYVSVYDDAMKNQAIISGHLEIYRRALMLKQYKVLVMEDDCEYLPEVLTLRETLEDLDKEIYWDVFYPGGMLYTQTYKTHSKRLRRISRMSSCHCYVPSRGVMAELIQPATEERIRASWLDVFLSDEIISRGHSFVANPMVSKQRPFWMPVVNKVVDYTKMFEEGKRWLGS